MMNWIEEYRVKRKSQFSTVTIFQTRDPKRLQEFVKSVSQEYAEIYGYIPWRGLMRIRVSKNAMIYEKTGGSSIFSHGARGIEAALDYMDDVFLRGQSILFVIQTHTRSDALTQALRTWMFDDDMYYRNNSICVFTENPEQVLDDEILKCAILIKIPRAQKRREDGFWMK
jgi:hypothetical protein